MRPKGCLSIIVLVYSIAALVGGLIGLTQIIEGYLNPLTIAQVILGILAVVYIWWFIKTDQLPRK